MLFSSCNTNISSNDITADVLEDSIEKTLPHNFIKGVNYARSYRNGNGYGSEKSYDTIDYLIALGVNSITINPFGSQENVDSTEINLWGRDRSDRDISIEKEIKNAHDNNLIVMFKPQIWSRDFDADGKWAGDIKFDDENKLHAWFESYHEYILHYAKLAEKTNTEIFVVGHEFAGISDKTDYWREVIKRVREVYSGKITYTAHHSDYNKIEFWDDVDYIGLSAYFTISDKKNPIVEELKEGWTLYIDELEKISKEFDKPIIFNEVGYRSVSGTANDPWKWDDNEEKNEKAQADAYDAMFQSIKNKDFIHGIYIWKYHTDPENEDRDGRDFQPYGKLAEEMIDEWFNE